MHNFISLYATTHYTHLIAQHPPCPSSDRVAGLFPFIAFLQLWIPNLEMEWAIGAPVFLQILNIKIQSKSACPSLFQMN